MLFLCNQFWRLLNEVSLDKWIRKCLVRQICPNSFCLRKQSPLFCKISQRITNEKYFTETATKNRSFWSFLSKVVLDLLIINSSMVKLLIAELPLLHSWIFVILLYRCSIINVSCWTFKDVVLYMQKFGKQVLCIVANK